MDQLSAPDIIAERLFEHPAFKNTSGFRDVGNDWIRQHWTNAVVLARLSTGVPPNPEAFARALYEYPQWGYRQPWGKNARVCKPWRDAAADVLGAL